ncbi:TPA: TIGR03745 family integrating conjugative element membrane protein [Serratia rubidaea]|nr:TIGR03745 family integrating conjugative element membrane protein [Serratia rubidaea]HDJ1451141.1 TIGR03745 family integrating conjugative element membrane protein [Serratia rubidaea]HDJ1464200.1 TIGR03745 family integrating conjugative element membrane protein [Serratia rubidaea]HDJ2774947.1 TIGR03745 family integrating conjugative element membrane protein [Serratia rubidaea]
MNAVVRLFRHFSARIAVVSSLALAASQPALAALPTVEPPSSGGGGGLMDTLKGHIQDGIVLIGLVLAAAAFIVVANAGVSTFHEVRDGKAAWGKFGAIIVTGVVLVVAVIWFVGKSAEILF